MYGVGRVLSYPLPKPVLIALILIPFLIGTALASSWEYAGSVPNSLQFVCDQVGFDSSHPSDTIGTVGVKNPSLVSIDGTWKFLFEGINQTTPWSSEASVSFHIPAGGTAIINFRLVGLQDHLNPGSTLGVSSVNVTLFIFAKTYRVSMRSFNYTSLTRNATVGVPFTQGEMVPCGTSS